MTNSSKPDWIKVKALSEESYRKITSVSSKYNLSTVCQEALCPNINECWSARTATFLILGNICTRNCKFCSVKNGDPDKYININEPVNIAKAVMELDLKHVVITSVDRDDLEDGGSTHYVNTVKEIRNRNDKSSIELLTPDFNGNVKSIQQITEIEPDIIGHNIETVERLSPIIRDKKANYKLSLIILKLIKTINPKIITKSAIQVGFGETDEEVKKTITDMKENNIDILVIGQYLRPSIKQVPVYEYVPPEKFKKYEIFAKKLNFYQVISNPLARSSYKASKCL